MTFDFVDVLYSDDPFVCVPTPGPCAKRPYPGHHFGGATPGSCSAVPNLKWPLCCKADTSIEALSVAALPPRNLPQMACAVRHNALLFVKFVYYMERT